MPDRLTDAIAEYQAALRIQPGDPETRLGLGAALEKLPGRRQEAIAQYEVVLQTYPDSEAARKSLQRLQVLEEQPATRLIK
jgi:tetratricopeptide (TPR) repeat protein